MTSPNRATFDLKEATLKTATVASGNSSTYGYPQTFSFGSDGTLQTQDSASGDAADGIIVQGNPGDTFAAGVRVSVALLSGGGILPVKVGTGGATCGKFGVVVADGVADSPALVHGGGTNQNLVGKFLQTGVAGDIIGMQPVLAWGTSA